MCARGCTCACSRPRGADCGIDNTGAALICSAARASLCLRERALFGIHHDPELVLEWRSHFRVPRIRMLLRTRALCLRGRAAGARLGDVVVWLCCTTPLWVLVRVCGLLRDR